MAALFGIPPELIELCLEFCCANELCALEQTCQFFHQPDTLNRFWGKLAKKRFGINRKVGKEAWREGLALVGGGHFGRPQVIQLFGPQRHLNR